MSFNILVDGEKVATVDEQVTKVSVMTSRGTAAEVGIADEGAIDIILTKAVPGGPRRLDHIEAQQRKENAERVEGQVTGQPAYNASKELTGTQGPHTYTADGEGVTTTDAPKQLPPDRDLAEGLEADQSDILTARIEAFNSSGDAQAAIDDNPADGSGSGTAYEFGSDTDSYNDPRIDEEISQEGPFTDSPVKS